MKIIRKIKKMQNKKNIVRDEIGQIIKNQRQKLSLRISWAIMMSLK